MSAKAERPAANAIIEDEASKTVEPMLDEPNDRAAPKVERHHDADAIEKARDSLEATLTGLQLTPQEEQALADEIRQLRELTKKLDETSIEIAAFGMVSRGKSSVLNALLGLTLSWGATSSKWAPRMAPLATALLSAGKREPGAPRGSIRRD
jgi:hypothetical protein